MGTAPEPPRVLQLFNVFGAPTEQTWFDAVTRLAEQGFSMSVRCEQRGPLADAVEFPVSIVGRVRVEPTDDVPGQMNQLAAPPDTPPAPHPALVHGHFGPRVLHAAPFLQQRIPTVISLYGYDASRLLRDPCWVDRYRWAAERGAVFVVLAERLRDRFAAVGIPKESIRVIHLGVDLDDWACDPTPPSTPPRFVFVGRLSPKKGIDVLLQAASTLPDARLDVIGDGPLDAKLRQQAQEFGLDGRAVFHGALPRIEIDRHLRGATALVAPSVVAPDGDEEGTPVVLMEAQALGLPAVTTDHAGNPEVLPPKAQRYVVAEHDAEALADAMRGVAELSAQERARLQDAGRAWIERHFDLAQMIEQYAALYRELLGH